MGVRPTRGAIALPVYEAIGLLSCCTGTRVSAVIFRRTVRAVPRRLDELHRCGSSRASDCEGHVWRDEEEERRLTPGTSLTGSSLDASMPSTVESSLTRARKRCELVRASRSSESLAWTIGWESTLTDMMGGGTGLVWVREKVCGPALCCVLCAMAWSRLAEVGRSGREVGGGGSDDDVSDCACWTGWRDTRTR